MSISLKLDSVVISKALPIRFLISEIFPKMLQHKAAEIPSGKYEEAVETAKHVIFDCPALCRRRSSYLEVVQEEGRQVIQPYPDATSSRFVTGVPLVTSHSSTDIQTDSAPPS
nr:unnamed protein product [Callosobruchus chinensis]